MICIFWEKHCPYEACVGIDKCPYHPDNVRRSGNSADMRDK